MDNIILKNEYESYVSKQQGISFMQSEKWSKVKTDWLSEQILLKDECGYVQSAVQMLIKKIPFLHTSFIYVPRGPLIDNIDRGLSFRECNKGYCRKTTYWGMSKAVRVVSPGGFADLRIIFLIRACGSVGYL